MWGRTTAAFALCACNQVFGLPATQHVDGGGADAPAIPACLHDTFDDGSIDAGAWSIERASNDVVIVSEEGGVLAIEPAPNLAHAYNGIDSRGTYDMVGGFAAIELVQAASQTGGVETTFYIGVDSSLSFMFSTYTNILSFVVRDGIMDSGQDITYDPASHRFLRFRHDASGSIAFETSSDARTWTMRRSTALAPRPPPSSVNLGVFAGSWDASNAMPGVAQFDNVRIVNVMCPDG